MIPDVPELNHALASLTVGRYADLPNRERVVACETVNRADGRGPLDSLPRIGIAYHRETKIGLESLIDRITLELRNRGHAMFDTSFGKKRLIATKLIALMVACSAST